IFTSVLSRMMPALLTRMSTLPKASRAVCTIPAAPSNSLTESKLGTAVPPAASISLQTSTAGRSSVASPDRLAPTSLTTTLAPSAARHRANSRPIPRPEPVTMATRSSSSMRRRLGGRHEPGPKRSTVDLLHRRQRKGIHETHLLGQLVGRQPRPTERTQRLECRRRRAPSNHDEGHTHLAHHVVGPGDDAHGGHVGMLGQHGLHLLGVHVVAAAHVHLLAAPG